MPFTEAQIKALSGKLSAKHVKTREHTGRTLSYIEGWHAIAEANQIFGFDAWDRETVSARCVWEGGQSGRPACAYIAQVRVRVRAGDTVVIREGSASGHGSGETPGEAHESALKAAETDAMKRALATFGNLFGLALYDKQRHGVRGAGARKNGVAGGQRVVWTVLSSEGEPAGTHGDPVEYCSALRRMLETIETAEEVKALWTRNRGTVTRLRGDLPQLKNDKEEHHADVLAASYKRRLQDLATGQGAEQVGPKAGDGAAVIDKSVLTIATPRRVRDKEHLRYVASKPCIICGRAPCHAHHLRFAQPRAMARKVSDEWAVPLCATHHRALHNVGDEAAWWKQRGIDPILEAQELWRCTRGSDFAGTRKYIRSDLRSSSR